MENLEHLATQIWYIRNCGAIGFGPLSHIEPRKIIISQDEKGNWIFKDGFSKKDLEYYN